MSATRSDVSQIQDEDVLRRMWQETEDFGRKKEIRAHMYKIREARLRDFYSSGDDGKDIQRTHSSPGIERKGPANTHHADSLADHSFLSLKSKEIRDSESPTRDVNYKISEKLSQDKGWTIKETNEKSQDGKTFSTSRVATTSGCDKIDGGVANYAAKNEQLASVYQDGDDNNFTKSVGASSKSVIKQEAQGGDENSKFYSSSTTSKSSSKVVTEHKSTSGDDYLPSDPSHTVIRKAYTSNVPEERIYDSQNVIRKTYTSNVPEEIKRQIPNYIDGNTKVYTETKTLPDGSTVTTTRYETTGGKSTTQSSSSSYSTSSKHVSSNEKNYSSNNVSKQEIKSVRNDNRNINDEVDNVRIIRYTQPVEEINVYRDNNEFTTVNKTNRNEDVRSFKNEDVRTFKNEDVRSYRNEDIRTSRNENIRTSRNEFVDINRTNKIVQETNLEDVRHFDDVNDNRRNIREEIIVTTQPREEVDKNTTVIRTTVVKNIGNKVNDKKVTSDDFINVERQHVKETSQKPRDLSPAKEKPSNYQQPRNECPKSSPRDKQQSPNKQPKYEEPRDKSPTKYQPNRKPDSYEQPERRQPINPPQSEFDIKETDSPYKTPIRPKYEQHERRQPIKPPTSEMDTKTQPTKGQYDTTYRTEFTTKRITVDVSPTHDAFARSLRSVTPDRSSPSRGSVRSLRTSTSSLRSSTSPEKNRHPTRYSPERRAGSPSKPSRSPTKFTSTETITKTNRKSPKRTTSTDTITRRRGSNSTDIIRKSTTKKVDENVVDTSTLTRRPKRKEVPRSRSTSPTDTVSDFEFITTKHEQVTDLDDIIQKTPKKDEERPNNLDFSSPRRPKKVTERSPTSPLTEIRKHSPSPSKDSNYPRRSSLKNTPTSPMVSPTKPREEFKPYNPKNKPTEKTDKVLRRTDTYEERCRQILGIVEKKKVEKNITDILFSDQNRPKSPEKKTIKDTPRKPSLPDSARRPSPDKFSQSPDRKPSEDYNKPRKDSVKSPDKPRMNKEISPERKPSNATPSQRRKSPEKPSSETSPGRKSPTKESPKIQEFPSQIRKSSIKEPVNNYPEKVSPTKDKAPKIQEFPSQIRKSPEKEPLPQYPECTKYTKDAPTVEEFPSQIRKSPERIPTEPYPERSKPQKQSPTLQEFPSQTRRSPERTPLEPYPERTKPVKESPKVQEFPSQVRKSPQREPLEPYSERVKPTKYVPKVQEFPSQIRKSPEREPLEPYPERVKPIKEAPKVQEFPSQIRKSPERTPLEPERTKPIKESPKVQEFPSQIRKSPQKEPLEHYPERVKPTKDVPKVQEFPSQIRKSPDRVPLPMYPELSSPSKLTSKIHEFNNKKTENTYEQTSSSDEEIRTDICEFPSQVRKSPKKEPLEPYPEKKIPNRDSPKIQEFPSQTRKSPQKEPLEPYPEKHKPVEEGPKINEFPSQTRKVPQKEPLEPYPEKRKPTKESPKIQEFPSQNRKVPEREPLEPYPEKLKPTEDGPKIKEFPSQSRKVPEKETLECYPQRQVPVKQSPQDQEYPSHIDKNPLLEQEYPKPNKGILQKKPLDTHPSKAPTKPGSKVPEFSSPQERQPHSNRQSPERHYPENYPSDRDSPYTEDNIKPQKSKPVSVTPEFYSKKPKQPKKQAAEDELLEKTTKYIDGKRVPVDEPLFVQKFISQLGSDDEEEIVTERNVTKTRQTVTKNRQSPERPSPVRRTDFDDLESEIIEDEPKDRVEYLVDEEVDFIVRKSPERLSPVRGIPKKDTHKTVKKDLSRKPQKVTDFINTEKLDTEVTLNRITKVKKDVPQVKRTTAKIDIVDNRKVKDTKTKTVQVKTVKEIRLVKPQVTTVKIEGVTRIRESRLDSTRKVQNGEIRSPLKPSQPKTKPLEKTVIKKTINEYPPQKRAERPTPERKNKPDEKKPVQKLIKPKDDAPKMYPRKEFIIDLKPKKPTEKTPKRAVVSTVINLSPKSKTPTRTVKKTVTTTVTKATKTIPTTSKPKVPKGAKPIQNGHDVSDEESDVEVIVDENEITEEVTTKITREVSDITKPSVKVEKTKPKLEKKCVSTKSIIINNTVADQREIIVDLQRSKSSREETPDRVWPVTTEEDSGIPRYPDQIIEPEEPIRKPKRTVDVPLTESEDVTEFNRITEIVDTKVTNLKTDECLLSVNEKVTKFLDSVESKKPKKPSGPAPKVERPNFVVGEDLEEDECLLSVTDKVNKFITTAEKLTLQERPKSPRCQNLPDYEDEKSVTSVSEKVSQFTSDKVKPKPKMVAPKVQRPDLTDVDDNLRTDECLLSVSDKVSKFITTAENLTKPEIKRDRSPNKKVTLDDISTDCPTIVDEMDMFSVPKSKKDDHQKPVKLVDIQSQEYPKYPEEIKDYPKEDAPKAYKPEVLRNQKEASPKPKQETPRTYKDLPKDRKESPIRKLKDEVEPTIIKDDLPKTSRQEVTKVTEVTKIRKESPTRKLSDSAKTFGTPKQEIPKTSDIPISRKESPTRKLGDAEDSTPKSTRRPSQEEKIILSSVGRLRSTESIKRARALFENIEKDKPKQKDILSRPSVFEARKSIKKDDVKLTDVSVEKKHLVDVKKKLTYDEEDDKHVPDVITPSDEEIPGYMRQLDRSLRAKSPHKQNVLELEEIAKGHVPHTEDVKPTKFGVVLKRTDSERKEERRRSSTIITEIEGVEKEVEIEEIYDLEILEAMLVKVVSYDIRRRIRAQIRVVKKLISENKLHTVTTVKKTTKAASPTRVPNREKSPEKSPLTEYQNKYIRKPSVETKVVNNHLQKHTDLIQEKDVTERTTEYQTSYTYNERRRSSDARVERREKSPGKTSPTRNKSPIKETVTKPKTPTTTTTTTTTITNLRKSPERKPKSETKIFPTELKKIVPAAKTPTDDKPEWVIQRNLKKVNERQVTKAKTITTNVTKKDTKRPSVSPSKDVKTIDVITSSYGVGPTDENGTPLFGLRALRAQNKNEKTKVQGTVMHSTYYSENGQEPVGEISVTKYSTDPADLGSTEDLEHKEGLLSKTTTQKFGYKDTPTYKSLTDKKKVTEKNDEIRTTTTTKVSRRGSVKEMSQKFLDNAVDTLKSERQTSYPKAGLILRTSSFKDTGSGSSREGSPTGSEEYHKTVTVKTSTSSKGNADTFLTNTSKVSNVQDVITRMKTEDIREGESAEDAEARSLLNKFLGSQVILAGMEGHVTRGSSSKSSASASATTTTSSSKRVTKVTSTITENGNPKTTTRTFTHPITSDVLETIWDDQTLKLLLEQSTEYEERRIIRLRLKQVMAEKEVCSDFVEKTIEESQAGNVEGESLLLPLLQGVLDAPEFEQTADSGTESGEDLRSGLIVEVQNALDKLSACLCSDSTDITAERRDSLLQLVTKLQANLSTTPQNNSERRLSQGRFSRRRSRQNRHTVGVTSEELEDARRLMEEFALRDSNFTNPLQKQISEGCVLNKQGEYKPVKYQPHQPIKNATAKPFSNSASQSVSGTSSSVETPTTESLDLLFTEKPEESAFFSNPTIQKREPKYRHSVSLDQVYNSHKRPLSQTFSLDYNAELDIKSVQQAVQQAAALKNMKGNESETDEETVRVDNFEPNVLKEGETVVLYDQSVYPQNQIEETVVVQEPQPDLILQTNPIYTNVQEEKEVSDSEKYNRFNTNNKKLRMKRANTIDIPKPLNFYQYDDESEGEMTDQEATRRSTYLALRGPIRIGKTNNNNTVPSFEPKTESDKKFMAFINKHNESAGVVNKINLWDKTAQNNERGTNWHRKFGNIKTNFENGEERKNVNSARNFWKSADDAVSAGTISYNGPKISRQNARNLQQMFEQKQKQNQIKNGEEKNVVTGSLKVDTKNLEPHKNYKFVPQPLSVNKFSHNPQSAFKPIQKTPNKPDNLSFNRQVIKNGSNSDDSTPETPLYLYSPKSFEANPVQTQPPWSAKTGERRVLSLAASKFENPPEEPKYKPRKLSKEKVTIPFGLQKVEPKEKLPTYMPPQNAAKIGGSVRKLSGQYDNLGNKISTDYVAQSSVKHVQKPLHQSAFASVPQNRNFGTYEAPKVTNAINLPKPSLPKTNYHPTPKINKIIEKDKVDNVYKSYEQKPVYPPQQLPSVYSNEDNHFNSVNNKSTHNTDINYNSYAENSYSGNELSPTFATSPKSYNQSYQPPIQNMQIHSPNYQPLSPKSNQNEQNLDLPEVLPSFHTTSPQVQNFQKLHNIDQQNYTQNSYENQPKYPIEQNYPQQVSPNYSQTVQHPHVEPVYPQNIHPEPHVFYNNVYDHNVPQVSLNTQSQPPQSSTPLVRPKYDSQVSQESLHEYNAISSKVMSAPITQQAVTVQQNQPKSRNEHDLDVAFNLKNSLQRKSEERRSPSYRADIKPKSPSFSMGKPAEPKVVVPKVPQSSALKAAKPLAPNFFVNDKPMNLESLEINERGESIVTSKFHIPMKGVDKKPTQGQVLSKSDSWHQICQENQVAKKPSPRASPNARTVLKSKSSHTLAFPKQFEASISKEEMATKNKIVEAYFGGAKSPQTVKETKKRSINRIKTSEKVSVSRTEKVETTKKTFSDGPLTKTQVTTRVTSQQITKKQMSPFAKFRQLDKQNSLNTPPSTPKTPTSGGPLFKFTDPNLSRSASTIKERLLQWCQMKTKEYENIKLDNFSTSWADGLAFCALVHHFLPDAFDYHQLTPNNRRHNFTLAFQVADEKADIAPLLDVEDMVATRRPDWKCVFTYVQSIYRRFKDED